jgi:hypothetical protein
LVLAPNLIIEGNLDQEPVIYLNQSHNKSKVTGKGKQLLTNQQSQTSLFRGKI